MHRTKSAVLTSLLALSLSGCVSNRPIRYYTIQLPAAPTLSANTYPVSLLVGNIGGQGIFHDTPIAYRVSTNEIGTYQYSRWAEAPVDMLKSKLIRMLNTSGNYESVAALSSTSEGQFVLRGKLYAFEEVDGGSIAGLVSMEFELCDRKSGKVLWSRFYSESEPVDGKKISAVVTALDLNLDRGLKQVAAGLKQYFSVNIARK